MEMFTEQNLLIAILVISILTILVLIFKKEKRSEGFNMYENTYYPYLYGMTTDACGKTYTDKGMEYFKRYEMCKNNPELWPCELMFQMGL